MPSSQRTEPRAEPNVVTPLRTASTAVACDKCHKNLVPAGASIKVKQYPSVAYTEAMHRLCIGCHIKKAKENKKHKEKREVIDSREIALRRRGLTATNVMLPPPDTDSK
jgi:hypothetical protein